MRRAPRGDADLTALRRLDGVLQQVAHGAADLLGIHEQFDVRSDVDADRHTRLHVAVERCGLLQDLGELGYLTCEMHLDYRTLVSKLRAGEALSPEEMARAWPAS